VKERRLPFVYPTASFAGLLFVLAAIWYAASSQNSPAAYLLSFGLTAVFLVSIPHTLINLAGLKITLESIKPAFAGQEVSLPIEIMNRSRATRHGIEVAPAGTSRESKRVDCVPAGRAARVTLRIPAKQRGEHKIGVLRLASVYPLGFVRVSKRFAAAQSYIVYPKPAGDRQLPLSRALSPRGRSQPDLGEGDDFAGVRAYVAGEPQRHIDWKAVARGQPLMTKQFTAEAQNIVQLDFAAVRCADVEARLSQLALWAIEAERARQPYSLRLPGAAISPAVGESHFHRCMRALSLFEVGTPCHGDRTPQRGAPTTNQLRRV
jgi:uncharacterized protein (DUF58 family)